MISMLLMSGYEMDVIGALHRRRVPGHGVGVEPVGYVV